MFTAPYFDIQIQSGVLGLLFFHLAQQFTLIATLVDLIAMLGV
jgi:hypothetical protein